MGLPLCESLQVFFQLALEPVRAVSGDDKEIGRVENAEPLAFGRAIVEFDRVRLIVELDHMGSCSNSRIVASSLRCVSN